jgi:hypothetical protein
LIAKKRWKPADAEQAGQVHRRHAAGGNLGDELVAVDLRRVCRFLAEELEAGHVRTCPSR